MFYNNTQDGEVKVWSRNGNLRTQLATYPEPVYDISFSPSSTSLLLANSNKLIILPLASNKQKTVTWEACSSGVVTCCDWNNVSGLIVSGAEDCCYRVFDR